MNLAKILIGAGILAIAGGVFPSYITSDEGNLPITIVLGAFIALGFGLTVSAMIEARLKRLKKEILDELREETTG